MMVGSKKHVNDLSISPLVANDATFNQSQQSSKYEWALTNFAIQKVHTFSEVQGCQTNTVMTNYVRDRKHVLIFSGRMEKNALGIQISYVFSPEA
jgi:hypothetical protein